MEYGESKSIGHTPGPWSFRNGIIEHVVEAKDRAIATIHLEHTRYGEPARSNIRDEDLSNGYLVAAAPGLRDAALMALALSEALLAGKAINTALVLEVRDKCADEILKSQGA
jgi:hypothetical protein